MDIRKIKKLIELLEDSDVTEIEIVEDQESVRIARGQVGLVGPTAQAQAAPIAASAPVAAPAFQPPAEDVPSGTVKAVLVDDGQPVEFGEPLIVID